MSRTQESVTTFTGLSPRPKFSLEDWTPDPTQDGYLQSEEGKDMVTPQGGPSPFFRTFRYSFLSPLVGSQYPCPEPVSRPGPPIGPLPRWYHRYRLKSDGSRV